MPTLCRLISLVSHLTPVVSSFLSRTSPLSGYFSFTAPFLLLISLSPPCFIGSFFILTLQFLLRSGYLIPYHLFVIPLIYSPILYLESPPAPLSPPPAPLSPLSPLSPPLASCRFSQLLIFYHNYQFGCRFIISDCSPCVFSPLLVSSLLLILYDNFPVCYRCPVFSLTFGFPLPPRFPSAHLLSPPSGCYLSLWLPPSFLFFAL